MVGIFDPTTSRFVTTDAAEVFVLTPGELAGATEGLWVLGGNDSVTGSLAPEFINGNQGDDTIRGLGGDDFLLGGRDNDILSGGDGNDFVSGNKGNDTLVGDNQSENGNDFLLGGQGDDLLLGGSGDDTLTGDIGEDGLSGGPGADIFILRTDTATSTQAKSADTILDFNLTGEEGDVIGLTDGISEQNLILDAIVLEENNLSGTVISVRSTGNVLGLVLGKAPADVQGRFITI